MKGAMVKGAGVDCSHLLVGIWTEYGEDVAVEFPPYELDENLHMENSRLSQWLDRNPRLKRICYYEDAPPDFRPLVRVGDIITIRICNSAFHLGAVCLGPSGERPGFTHAMRDPIHQVIHSHFDDGTYRKRFMGIYRPIRL